MEVERLRIDKSRHICVFLKTITIPNEMTRRRLAERGFHFQLCDIDVNILYSAKVMAVMI